MGIPTYIPAAGDTLVPGAKGVTELGTFVGGAIGACGEAAVAAAGAVYGLFSTTSSAVTQLAQQAVNTGHTYGPGASIGGTSPENLQWLGAQHGLTLQSQPWQQALSQDAGQVPVILGLGNGSAVDPWAPHLTGHYETVLGRTSAGNYIVSDPNSAQSQSGGLVVQTPGQIAAANPFAALVPSNILPASTLSANTSSSGGAPWDVINSILTGLQQNWRDIAARSGLIVVGVILGLVGLTVLLFDREHIQTAANVARVVK